MKPFFVLSMMPDGKNQICTLQIDITDAPGATPLPYKLKIDLAYVNRHGVLRDLGLLARTFVLPLHQIGVRLVEGLPGRSFVARTVPALGFAALLLAFTAIYAIEAGAPV